MISLVKQMGELIVPYPDFKVGDTIDPEQHDINNAYIMNKVNELIEAVNITYSADGATDVGFIPIAPFTGTNVQEFLNELIARLQGVEATLSGSSLIGTPSLTRVLGTNVEAQLASIDEILKGVHVTTGSIADRAITSTKIGLQAVKQENLDPNLLTLLPQSLLAQKVLTLEAEMDVAQVGIDSLEVNKAEVDYYNVMIPITWSDSAPYTITVPVTGVLASDVPFISPAYSSDVVLAKDQKRAWSLVSRAITKDGEIEFICFDNKPSIAIPVQVKVVE